MTGNAAGKESAGYPFLCQARGLKHVRGRRIVIRRTCRLQDDGPGTAVAVTRNRSRYEVAPTVVAQNLRVVEFDKITGCLGERFPRPGQDFLHINGAQLAHRTCYSILLPVTDRGTGNDRSQVGTDFRNWHTSHRSAYVRFRGIAVFGRMPAWLCLANSETLLRPTTVAQAPVAIGGICSQRPRPPWRSSPRTPARGRASVAQDGRPGNRRRWFARATQSGAIRRPAAQVVLHERILRDHHAQLVDRRLTGQRGVLELQAAVAVDPPDAGGRQPSRPIVRAVQ